MSRRPSTLSIIAILILAIAAGLYPAAARQTKSAKKIKLFDKKRFKVMTKDLAPQEETMAEQATKWAQFNLTISCDKKEYKIGELTDVTITSDRDAYVIVYYVNAQGKTAIVCPSPFCSNNKVRANDAWSLVDNKGRKFRQAGPEGTETLQVVATEQPIDLASLPGLKLPPAARRPVNTAINPNDAAYMPTGDTKPATVGPTVAVVDADAFVEGAEKAIRNRITARCKKLAKTHKKDISGDDKFEESDSVFGLGSVTYKVAK